MEERDLTMDMIGEFKKFIMRGNVVDLAIGVIIGGAFSKIVSALVDDILMPFVGIFLGGVDFSSLAIRVGSATLKYGSFIQNVINFLIIGLVLFTLIKTMEQFKKKEEVVAPAAPQPSNEEVLLAEIRDLLKK